MQFLLPQNHQAIENRFHISTKVQNNKKKILKLPYLKLPYL